MSMKEAFETFFHNNVDSWKSFMNTRPKIQVTERFLKSGLLDTSTIMNSEAEWEPKLQTDIIDFENIERKIGFKINPQLKDYLSTYWFLALEGKTDKVNHLVLTELLPNDDFETNVINYFRKEDYHYLNDSDYYLLCGFGCIDGDDSYLIMFNNANGQITAVQNFDKKSVVIAESIEELLVNMKGIWTVL